jgi:hypothetical protein
VEVLIQGGGHEGVVGKGEKQKEKIREKCIFSVMTCFLFLFFCFVLVYSNEVVLGCYLV